MNQTTAPPPDVAIGPSWPDTTEPLIRPALTGLPGFRRWVSSPGAPRIDVQVSPLGHYWRSDDDKSGPPPALRRCRGCGRVARWFAMDEARCAHPATAQDIASALLGHLRPGPARMRSHRVRFIPTQTAEAAA